MLHRYTQEKKKKQWHFKELHKETVRGNEPFTPSGAANFFTS
jgi:hypothetical protein